MRPEFDSKDAAILAVRIATWQAIEGPRVGDFVKMPDGTLRRFTHDWDDSMQTTVAGSHPCVGDESFYFGGAYMSFSGSLDSAIAKADLRDTGEQRDGKGWFFHHDFPTAHNGVTVKVPCRVYEYEAVSPYARRVRELEAEGMTTSDAQGAADVEVQRGMLEGE